MHTITKLLTISPIVLFFLSMLNLLCVGIAKAEYNPAPTEIYCPTRYSDGVYYDSIHKIKTYLRENGWVSPLVDDDQLEYELLLLEQPSSITDYVPASLAIAQVAQESRFDPNAENNGAIGLMQIIPNYHQDRLDNICEEPTFDKWYEPRYNIMVGLSYMDDLLDNNHACGDKAYALMMYNQGPASGTRTYLARGIVSDYASTIIVLKQELDEIIENGGASDAKTG